MKISTTLKNINRLVNVFWWLQVAFTIISIPVWFYISMPKAIRFTVIENGNLLGPDANNYEIRLTSASGMMEFPNSSYPTPLLEQVLFVFGMLLGLYIFFQIKKIINSVVTGIIFEKKNFQRLKRIGLILIFSTPLWAISTFFIQKYYAANIDYPGIRIYNHFNIFADIEWMGLISGLMIIVLSEVFKEGFSLKQETELTI